MVRRYRAVLAAALFWSVAGVACAETPQADETMSDNADAPGDASVETAARLRDVVRRIDPRTEFNANGAVFTVDGVAVTFVYDTNADRMRLAAPVVAVEDIEPEIFLRMMQANFESALDARYGVAQGVVWSTFIHPLSSLGSEAFGAGIAQTVNLVRTFGGTYSSGVLVFGGGDGVSRERELVDELTEKSRDI